MVTFFDNFPLPNTFILKYPSLRFLTDAFLRGKLIAYDNDENQIGWIDSDCTDPSKQSRIPFFLRRVLHNKLL